MEFKKVNNGSECSKGIVIWILFERIKNIFVLKNISELGCLVIIFLSFENYVVIFFILLIFDKKVEF